MMLASFFGIELLAPLDYVLAYVVGAVVLVVGIILLVIVNKKTASVKPKDLYKKEQACVVLVDSIIAEIGAENKKCSAISTKAVKLQMEISNLAYVSTVIAEDDRDITFETVRTAYSDAVRLLDELNLFTCEKEKALEVFTAVKEKLSSTETRLQK